MERELDRPWLRKCLAACHISSLTLLVSVARVLLRRSGLSEAMGHHGCAAASSIALIASSSCGRPTRTSRPNCSTPKASSSRFGADLKLKV